jgi:gibberellin 2-oxidase
MHVCCSVAVNEYVGAVRHLACRVLDLLGEGLGLRDPTSLSRLISAVDSDSLLRINHYPTSRSSAADISTKGIGFGEHTDPQILSLLRANDVDGLQVLLPDGHGGGDEQWVQVPADPSAFFINVGDLLQVGAMAMLAITFLKVNTHHTIIYLFFFFRII